MNIGYHDVTNEPQDDIRWRMSLSPTGRQIGIDGNLVLPIVAFDPNLARSDSTQVYPDGSPVIYIRAGVTEIWAYRRASGWQQI